MWHFQHSMFPDQPRRLKPLRSFGKTHASKHDAWMKFERTVWTGVQNKGATQILHAGASHTEVAQGQPRETQRLTETTAMHFCHQSRRSSKVKGTAGGAHGNRVWPRAARRCVCRMGPAPSCTPPPLCCARCWTPPRMHCAHPRCLNIPQPLWPPCFACDMYFGSSGSFWPADGSQNSCQGWSLTECMCRKSGALLTVQRQAATSKVAFTDWGLCQSRTWGAPPLCTRFLLRSDCLVELVLPPPTGPTLNWHVGERSRSALCRLTPLRCQDKNVISN